MNITIYEAGLNDCERVYPLVCELASGGRTGGGGKYRPSFEKYAKTYKLLLSDKGKKYFVAKDGADIAGVAGLAINQSLVESGSFAFIEELVVGEKYRRNGVGQKLLDACIAFAGERECQSIVLTSGNERYAAHKLYEKNGFEKVGVKYAIDFT
ncbi:MAG: GNAT family N-acetyltransferase [Clostridiales bacterium]|jgi:ribosomal protein S18 acetylase RimI-like enzyme|nr:GNAT family N-acetyltransferase [Clostridiales bacterium]